MRRLLPRQTFLIALFVSLIFICSTAMLFAQMEGPSYRNNWPGNISRGGSVGSYVPTDGSPAGLVFSNASGHFQEVGGLIFVWGTVTYPSTANASNAAIKLPIQPVGTSDGQLPGLFFTSSSAGWTIWNGNAPPTLSFINSAGAGGTFKNTDLSLLQVVFWVVFARG